MDLHLYSQTISIPWTGRECVPFSPSLDIKGPFPSMGLDLAVSVWRPGLLFENNAPLKFKRSMGQLGERDFLPLFLPQGEGGLAKFIILYAKVGKDNTGSVALIFLE